MFKINFLNTNKYYWKTSRSLNFTLLPWTISCPSKKNFVLFAFVNLYKSFYLISLIQFKTAIPAFLFIHLCICAWQIIIKMLQDSLQQLRTVFLIYFFLQKFTTSQLCSSRKSFLWLLYFSKLTAHSMQRVRLWEIERNWINLWNCSRKWK